MKTQMVLQAQLAEAWNFVEGAHTSSPRILGLVADVLASEFCG